MSEALPDFICPLVLERMRVQMKEGVVFRSRFRSLTFQAPRQSPVEQLAQVGQCPAELGKEHEFMQSIQVSFQTFLVARTASVIDWSDPKKRLPGNGLKFFRARVESSWGDPLDVGDYFQKTSPVGECFWGTGSRPAVITGGVSLDQGSSLLVYCHPRVPDIEVELGFWFVENHGRQYGNT